MMSVFQLGGHSPGRQRFLTIALLMATLSAAQFAASPANPQPGPRWQDRPDFWHPGWMRRHMWGRKDIGREVRARMQRHWTFMHGSIPSTYEDARSTVKRTKENVQAGGKLYQANCVSCHGKQGLGDGTDGRSLSPSPALLAYLIQRPIAVDGYLLWTISDGGAAFKTDMPAFKDTLPKDDIWKVIAYMRAGFPAVKK